MIVDFKLILNLLLLSHEILVSECAQMFALDFGLIETKFLAGSLILDLGFNHEPGGKRVITHLTS